MPITGGFNSPRDFYYEVGQSNVDGHRRFVGLGNNPDVDQASVPEHIWPGGGLYPWIPIGGVTLEIVSSSTQDALGGTGIYGYQFTLLDINYNEVVISVQTNGTTPVTISGGPYLRINDGRAMLKGSGAPQWRALNIGDITLRDAGGGTVRAIIPAGRNFLRQAVYTIPAGYRGEVISGYIAFNRGTGGGATRYLTVTTYIQNSSGITIMPLDLSCDGEAYRHDGVPGIIVPEKSDFAMEIISVSSDNSDVTGAFLGVMKRMNVGTS